MNTKKIYSLLAVSLCASPLVSTASPSSSEEISSSQRPRSHSYRTSARRMKHQLACASTPFANFRREERLTTNPGLKKQADDIATFAQENCLNEGTLEKVRDYVYLKLNSEYLATIFNKIKETNPNVRWPSFHGGIGPHISIIRHDEWKGIPPQKIAELGSRYLFTPVRVDVIETAHKRLWVLVIEPSAELAALRKQYAVGDLPHGHEFHITLAQESFY